MIASTLSVWGIQLCEGSTPKLDPSRNAIENYSPYTNEHEGRGREGAGGSRTGMRCGACVLDAVDEDVERAVVRGAALSVDGDSAVGSTHVEAHHSVAAARGTGEGGEKLEGWVRLNKLVII